MRQLTLAAILLALALAGSAQPSRTLFVPAASPIEVGNRPADVILADVNGDGALDFLTANLGSNNISVLVGNGRGGFAAARGSPVPVIFPGDPSSRGLGPHLLATGDFNGDARPDLAVTAHDSNDLIILLNDGRGSFAAAPGSPFPLVRGPQAHNHGLAVADANADGHLDLATSNCNGNSVSVLLGNGQGGFRPAAGSPYAVGRCPYPLALGDINQDGHLDIVTPNVNGSTVSVLLGDGRGGFAAAPNSPLSVQARPYHAGLADLNGDGKLDVVTTHDDVTTFTVLLGDEGGGFAPAPGSPVDAGHRGGKFVLADFNRDAKLDLAMGTSGHNVVVLLGNGRGGFAPAPGSPFPAGRGPWSIAVGDLNGDGRPDLVTTGFESGDIRILLGQ